MKPESAQYRYFPARVFVAATVIICVALAVSAIYTYSSMISLHDLYLEDRSHEVSAALVDRLRGPERLDPGAWLQVMNETLESGTYPWLSYLAIRNESGKDLATSGQESKDLHFHDMAVRAPRWGGAGATGGGRGRGGWGRERDNDLPASLTLRVGIDPSSAAFITRQAYIHLSVSGAAILTLSALAYFLARTFRSFLELQRQEESQRHLASLGKLSATLAHEIRNPLGAIKGLTQVAQERLPEDHDTQELMTTVVTEAERLERLVSDLLTFARPRAMSLREVDLGRLVTDVAVQLHHQAVQKNIRVNLPRPETDAVLRADPDGLRQVLLNLFLNALEAAPEGSEVGLAVTALGRDRYLVEVFDEGPGIGDKNPEELFQPFVTTKTRGTGLGLPVSRQIVERLGGTIELHNRDPKGAVCRVTLPAQTPSHLKATAGVAEA
jgi:signal transduction histidine kinase